MRRDRRSIIALKPGWAEQDTEIWWTNLKAAISTCTGKLGHQKYDIGAIGISYQMHGLVAIDKNYKVLRPSIIWCDSRAVEYGEKAFSSLGKDYCLSHLLNSPGNFTASKLAWVKENEPDLFSRIHKIMLPGDYIALKLTGEISTSYTGLSEGIFWDFTRNRVSEELMDYFGFSTSHLPEAAPSFSIDQAEVQIPGHAAPVPHTGAGPPGPSFQRRRGRSPQVSDPSAFSKEGPSPQMACGEKEDPP